MGYDKWIPMGEPTIIAAIGLVLSIIPFLFLRKSQGSFVAWSIPTWIRITPHGRHTSLPNTPSRSLSPEKKIPDNAPPTTPYKDLLPPSSRDTLAEASNLLPAAQKHKLRGLNIDEFVVSNNLIPFTTDYKEYEPSAFTPMGISIEEVKALGDFPDYATLSGVPLPQPYKEFKIETALPRPYRPFRWAYHQTMSLTKLEPEWWLELEKNYTSRIAERKALYAEHGKQVLDYLPGSELGCKEIMEMALQFLCARYPHYFSLMQSTEHGYVFKNGILKNETVVGDMHPLHVLLENIPEDFAVMLRNAEDGCYYFRAGILCSSLGWNVATKLGLQLKEIHAPIPDYKEKMEFSMDRYFSRLPSSRPIQRGSWGLETDTPLYLPPTHPHLLLRQSQSPHLPPSRIHLRVDWQTLRRLPLSGAIVFNFKALFTPIAEFRDEAYIPALLAKVLREGKEALMRYKGTWHVEHVVLPVLEEWAREQVREGRVEGGWDVGTLGESPFWRGWEEKWRRGQGF